MSDGRVVLDGVVVHHIYFLLFEKMQKFPYLKKITKIGTLLRKANVFTEIGAFFEDRFLNRCLFLKKKFLLF